MQNNNSNQLLPQQNSTYLNLNNSTDSNSPFFRDGELQELIGISQNKRGQNTCFARELYDFLQLSKTHWKRWYND